MSLELVLSWQVWLWQGKMMGRGVLGKTRSILGREVWVDEVQWILAGGLVDGERVSWYYCMYVHTLATRSATTKHEPMSVNCHCHSVILFPANTKCGYRYPCTPSLRPERIKGMFNLSYCKHSASWMPRSCRRKLKGPRKPQPNQP